MRTKMLPLIGLLVALSIVAAACVVATPQVVEKEVVVTATPEPEAEITGPVSGGTLRVGLYQDVTGLLPASGGGGWPLFVMLDGFYDPLVEYDDEFNLLPALAESWEFEDDNKTVVFHLREGVQFHDGTPFNAEAVKFNLERYINPTGLVIWDFTDILESVEVVDDYTVKLHLYEPNVAFLYNLAQDPGQIMSPTALQEKGEDWLSQNPVGTGPYMIESWEPGTEIVMVRNPDYWRVDEDGNQLPYLDRIEWKILIDNTVRGIVLATDQIDLMTFVPAKDYEALKMDEDVDLWVQGGGLAFVEMSNDSSPFDIKENRMAVEYAIDYDAIRDTVFYGLGEVPTGSLFPTAMWPHDPSRPKLERDLEKAKELLAEAGNPDGFSFDMAYEPDPVGQQLAEVMQANLAEVGIEANLVKTEFARWMEVLQTDRHAVDMAVPMFGRMRPNAEEYFTADWLCEGFQAYSNWCNEDFDNLIRQSEKTFDLEERLDLLAQAEDIYIEETPGFPISYWPFIHATNKRVQNYSIHPAGELNYRWLWLMPE